MRRLRLFRTAFSYFSERKTTTTTTTTKINSCPKRLFESLTDEKRKKPGHSSRYLQMTNERGVKLWNCSSIEGKKNTTFYERFLLY